MFAFNETWTKGLSSIANHVSRTSGHKAKVKGHFR